MRRREFIQLIAGSASGWPLGAGAQQREKSYRIGYLALLPGEDATMAKAFSQRLLELGYSAGYNLELEYRSADGKPGRLAPLASELVQATPDVLVAGFGTLAAKAAAAASKTIPIVFITVGDPVGAGLVNSLNKPGGNVTGLSAQGSNIISKQLQILNDLVSGKHAIAILSNPDTPNSALAIQEVRSAAGKLDQALLLFEARTDDGVPRAIEGAASSGAAGLLVVNDPLLYGARRKITELVAAAKIPALYGNLDFVEAGGLMSYAPDLHQLSRRAADYVDKLLKGARPADLPVEQPTKFDFVVNLKAARDIAIALPPSLLALADRVIE